MKNSTLSRHLTTLLLIVVILLLAGCGGKLDNPKKTDSSQNNLSQQPTDENDVDSSEKQETESDEYNNPLSGEFSYNASILSTEKRDDSDEVKAPRNCSNLNNHLIGCDEKEAEKLRNEILDTGNTEQYYEITGTKYYISPGGKDVNDGTSPASALRTPEAIDSIGLKSGDAVLFERNSVFRLKNTLSAMKGVTYGSYGEGEKPKLLLSSLNFANCVWKPTKKKNVWQTEYLFQDACNMVIDQGKEIGCRKTSLRDLDTNTYFYQDDSLGVIYLYCDKGNPSRVYEDIEIAPKSFCFVVPFMTSNVVIDNLCLKYGGWGGIEIKGQNEGISVTNCELGFMGGAISGSVRLGNAIENWEGCRNCRFEHNWIYQTFDIAISPQGFNGDKYSYEDISISNNLMEYNSGDIEFWDDGATFKNLKMDNNIMRFTSLGWGNRLNDGGVRGIEGVFIAHTNKANIINLSCRDNIVDCPGRQIINWNMEISQLTQMHIAGTKIYYKSSYRTTTQVLRYFKREETADSMIGANNLEELKRAINRFDLSAEIYWYE